MAQRDVTFDINANVEGEQQLEAFARELEALGQQAGESAPEVAQLAERLRAIASEQSLVNQFRAQRTALDQTSTALSEARERTAALAVQIRNTAAPTRQLQNQFERARREVRQLAQAEQDQRLGLQQLRGALQGAGISTRNLAEAQRLLNLRTRVTRQQVDTLRNRLIAAGDAGEEAGRRTRRGLDQAGDEARSTADEARNIRDSLVGLFAADQAAELAKHLAQTADQWTEINAKLKLVTDSEEEFNRVQEELFQISQESRTALAGNVALYARSSDAVKRLGGTTKDALKFTEAIAKALKLSGASASEATSVQLQLSQGLASGVLRGEEFNAVMENGLRVSQALAAGLGVPIGALRKLAEQGELTAERVIAALLSQKETLDKEYATIPITVGGALQQLENQWLKLIGTQDKASGASRQVVEAIQLFAKNLDSVLATAVTVGNVATIAARTATLVVFRLVSNVVNAFDTLTLGAIDAVHNRAQALEQTVAAIAADIGQDFKDIETAWEGVGQAAQKTNKEIGEGSEKAAKGLAKAGDEAEKTGIKFKPIDKGAEELAKALKTLGIDATQATVGIRSGFNDLVASFDRVVGGFEAGNPIIGKAAEKLIGSAQSAEEAALAQRSLNEALRDGKLDLSDHIKLSDQLSAGLKEHASAAAQASEESRKLSSALQALGIDAAQVTTGIRAEFSALTASFGEVAQGFNAGNEVISLAAQKLALSAQSAQEAALAQRMLKAAQDANKLSTEGYAKATELLAKKFADQSLAAIKAAQSSDALGAALASANQLYEAGIITSAQYGQSQVAVQAQINALAGATDTAARSTENLGRSMEGTAGSAAQATQSLKQAEHSARGFAAALAAIYIAQREEFRAVSEEAAATFNRIAEREGRLRLGTSDFFGPLIEATKFTQWQIDGATSRLGTLIERLQSGRGVTEQFIESARDSVDGFSILGNQKLDALRSEIDSASQKLQQLQAQAEQARESLAGIADQLRDELDRMAGDQEEIERRRYERQLERIAELEKAGGEAARREAEQSRKLAEQLHQQKLENLRKEAQAKQQQEEARAQEEKKRRQEEETRQEEKAPREEDELGQKRARRKEEAPPRLSRPLPAPAPPRQKEVTKVIRVEFGNNRSLELPADQERNFLDLLEQSKRAS